MGNLSHPSLIGHVRYGGNRIIFDFRSQQIFLSGLKKWKTYHELLEESSQKKCMTDLIQEWETLKWHEFDFRREQINTVEAVQNQH